MSSIVTDVGRTFHDYPEVRVYVRQRWSDPWEFVPELRCDGLQFTSSPAMGSASLHYLYGHVVPIGETRFIERAPLSILGHWVKVEIDQAPNYVTGDERPPIKWHGRIWEEPRDRAGLVKDFLDVNSYRESQSGLQQFNCFGLEYELEKAYVTTSIIEKASSEDGDPGEATLGRAISFNRSLGDDFQNPLDTRGNASTTSGSKGTRIFARNIFDASTWTVTQMIEYLLAYHTAKDQAGDAVLPWSLDLSEGDFLSWHKPPVECQGRTLKAILDELIDRRRLIGWRVLVKDNADGEDEGGEQVQVKPFTFATEPILSDAEGEAEPEQLIPANPNQYTLDFDSAVDIAVASTVTSQAHVVDRVVLTGARRTTTMTISAKDNTLFKDWITDEQNAYNTAASTHPDYAAADRLTKEKMNFRARVKHKLERVYRHFRLPTDWDGKSGNGVGEGSKAFAMPQLDFDGKVKDESMPFWVPDIRFENYLPLETGREYADVEFAAPDNLPANELPEGTAPEFRRPFAAMKIAPVGDAEGPDVYMAIGDLGHALSEDEDNGGRTWNANLRMLPQAPAVALDVNHRGWQHKIAKAEFVALSFDDHMYEEPADLDWNDNLLATVCFQNDEYVKAVYPRDTHFPDTDAIREQLIKLGDDYRLDYVAPYTVVDVVDGQLKRVTGGGGFVRNDLAKMRTLAKIAHAWYSRPRKAFTLGYRQILALANVGDMITRIGPGGTEEVNSVVTALAFDLSSPEPMTTVQTDFAEFDATAFERGKARVVA